MTDNEIIKAIESINDILTAVVHYDESIDYQLTTDDTDWLETAKWALERATPKFVTCPKGFQGYRDTRYYCPNCNKPTKQHEDFCHKCGQAVKYPKEVYVKSENKILLDWSEES